MLHHDVKDRLLQQIRSGTYAAGARLPTQQALANEFGVACGTIAKAIRELRHEGLVESRHRGGVRVLPNGGADRRGPIGLLIRGAHGNPDQPYRPLMAAITHLATAATVPTELRVIPAEPYFYHRRERSADITALINSLAGLMIMNVMDVIWLAELKLVGTPVVVMDRNTEQLGLDCVVFENTGAAFDLTARLIADGHRRIAFLSQPVPTSRRQQRNYDPASYERQLGYRMAHRAAGIAIDDAMIVHHHPDDPDACVRRLLDDPGITAVVADHGTQVDPTNGDRPADHLTQRGMAVVGWQDWSDPDGSVDGLRAYVQFDLDVLGRRAFDLLSARLDGDRTQPIRLTIEGDVTLASR